MRTTTVLRRRVGVVAGVFVLLFGGSVAVASWTATGTGQGSARAASVSGLVVTAGSPLGALYPLPADTTPATGYGSGTVGSVSTTVANPNPFPVTITSATVGSVTSSPLGGRTCAAGSVLPTSSAPIALSPPVTLAAGSAPTAVTVPGALYMVSTAEDGCQGASFSVPVTVTGASA
ncbi:MAG TPA: hypothetical protein VEZ18_12080 [Geodermatophilus sp.]|jgi:hypothetical protein|nr:hypothetical protein [Geodermatophilus sp.]